MSHTDDRPGTDAPGITAEDREVLEDLASANSIDARSIRRAIEQRRHAARSSRFDWAPDPDRDYCGRCGAAVDVHRWTVEAASQRLEVCEGCFKRLRGLSVRGKLDLEVLDRPGDEP